MKLVTSLAVIAMLAAVGVPVNLAAQETAPTQEAPTRNSIVVTAQRSGAPMWTIDTPTGTVIVVGEITAVPKSTPWQPDRLEEATAQADRVIIRARPKFSAGDVFRLIFRGGRIMKLPDGNVAADYLDTAQRTRLAALEEAYDIDYDRRSFLMTSFDLLARRLDFDDETTDDATDVVKDAADDADLPILRPERFRGEDLLDNLAEADPRDHIPCLEAAMSATEQGQDIIEARGRAWRTFDILAVMENPLEQALGQCWPWADEELGEVIREQWTGMIADASAAQGTTVAVVPLRVLAESDGVLDQLAARGFTISGPDWR